ncbi:MAG: 30S ribosomal protein S25e [Candidatus Bathyarchaeota archaeon BA2]|nr:MAG: 30S ribosomal protein S25e [Candidatus Bathyarchaeota archaeon BA2]
MGGKKKLTLKQMERIQARRNRERKERKSGGSTPEKKSAGIIPPDLESKKVIGELKKIRALTPYAVATRFDLRLSVAKDFLEELERRGIVEYISGSKNLKIYRPLD